VKRDWIHLPSGSKSCLPQYLISLQDYAKSQRSIRSAKLAFRDITNATNERTFIGAVLPDVPSGNTLGVLECADQLRWLVSGILNTFAFDWIARHRLAGTHMNKFTLFELPTLPYSKVFRRATLPKLIAGLSLPALDFARLWSELRAKNLMTQPWKKAWAITETHRLSCKCALEAVVAALYGYSAEGYRRVLEHCDYSENLVADKRFTRKLDPRGFWRVDKEKPPHLRHSVLSLVAFEELERIGLDAFLALNDGEGWMLPETLRLADYGLGHDDRAKEHQQVATVLGPRFYDWQLSQSVEESWEECEMHAELLNKLVPPPAPPEKEPEPEQPQASLAF
jgi:hypothetical protein